MKFSEYLKYILITTCLFLISPNVFAQQEECGFKFTVENQRYYDSLKGEIERLERQFLDERQTSRNSTILSSIPVKAHILRTSIGTGGLTSSELDNALSVMNTIYLDSGIQFFLCDDINYINNDDYYDYETNEEGALTSANNVNGVINIYFANSVVSSSSGGGLCGYAYFPGGPETILMANDCATNGSTLSHEMGHFFALSHTHGNSNVFNSTEELVDGSNCATTGDFICDTPADPKLGNNNVNQFCEYFDFAQDANSQYYEPDPLNLMSYSRKECRTQFSAQQYARINAVLQTSRSNLACPSFNVDFVANQTQSCESNLTVDFTDNSAGATTWSWDVDGDDIVDYTTQNVSHTYNTVGDYDVALTVSNGSETISKVKSEYIEIGAQEISTSTITLNLNLDDWPAETSWQFVDGNGSVLYSGGPYVDGVDDFTMKTEIFNINANLCYSFIISDSYGDGICCFSGNGNYELVSDSGAVLAAGGDYNFGATDNFFSGVLNTDRFSTTTVTVYPNPTIDIITINVSSLPDYYSIYNALGQILIRDKINLDTDLSINVESLTSGIYFIKLTKGSASQIVSFIKN